MLNVKTDLCWSFLRYIRTLLDITLGCSVHLVICLFSMTKLWPLEKAALLTFLAPCPCCGLLGLTDSPCRQLLGGRNCSGAAGFRDCVNAL